MNHHPCQFLLAKPLPNRAATCETSALWISRYADIHFVARRIRVEVEREMRNQETSRITMSTITQQHGPVQLNIVIVGETGIGKSTWIKEFAHYLYYSTLEEAVLNRRISIIPTTFVMHDENSVEQTVTSGTHENEMQEVGQPCTQFPQTYVFKGDKITIKLIDTPGI